MAITAKNARDIFLAALERDGIDRAAYLEQTCRDDAVLRKRVEALLRADDEPGAFLSEARVDPQATAAPNPTSQKVGAVVAGRYKLLEEIGDGGMGTVWMAEQREPVKRLVAVKLIKAGMDSKAVLARFEAERQALAMMDHPNIAKVFDGGTTEDGSPFFVMELVKGLPLTEYCDARRLPIADRLELFVQICSAVQHAHQKAVIHRDLKPSNVLVTEYDGKPLPKVIDFGLAKALNATSVLTERTLHTAYGTVVGTPLYMAPEQVGINALDVDTRTDIYALGVTLYELLTGSTPLEKARFKEAAWDEVKRLIREEEPPRPSTRLSSDSALPSLAANRRIEPVQLPQLVRGDLDWIVMKALDKERARRYETASGLAKDVQRYLVGEAVDACPPSTWYRLRNAHRHRMAVGTVAGIVVLLATFGVAMSIAFVAAMTAKKDAEIELARRRAAERQSEFQLVRYRERLIEDALEAFISGDLEQGRRAIQTAEAEGVSESAVRTLNALSLMFSGKIPEAVEVLRIAVKNDPQSVLARSALIGACVQSGDWLFVVDAADALRDVDPRTDCERLMVAWALDSLPDIEDLIKKRPSWAVARVLRSGLDQAR